MPLRSPEKSSASLSGCSEADEEIGFYKEVQESDDFDVTLMSSDDSSPKANPVTGHNVYTVDDEIGTISCTIVRFDDNSDGNEKDSVRKIIKINDIGDEFNDATVNVNLVNSRTSNVGDDGGGTGSSYGADSYESIYHRDSSSIVNPNIRLEDELGLGDSNANSHGTTSDRPAFMTSYNSIFTGTHTNATNDLATSVNRNGNDDSDSNSSCYHRSSRTRVFEHIRKLEEELEIGKRRKTSSTKPATSWFYNVDFDDDTIVSGGIREHIRNLEGKVHKIEHFEKRLQELERETVEADEDKKFPRDCYSFIALDGPIGKGWNHGRTVFFLFGVLVFLIQILFYSFLIWSVLDSIHGTTAENDNPDAENNFHIFAHFLPSNAKSLTKCTQVLSLVTYVLFPESGVQDAVMAYHLFPRSRQPNYDDSVGSLRIACILRALQSLLGIFAAWILVMQSSTVVDIVLNFTALNFVSNIDELAFSLVETGAFGLRMKRHSEKIKNKDLPAHLHQGKKHLSYRRVMVLIGLFYVVLTAFVMNRQKSTNFWITKVLRVEFRGKNETLNKFSGCYALGEHSHHSRHTYNNFNSIFNDNATISYCANQRQWILFENKTNNFDPCLAGEDQTELAHSVKTDDFDIAESFEETWYSSLNMPLEFVFNTGEEDGLSCEYSLGDGKCDVPLNTPEYQYDYGDCCAASCEGQQCGSRSLTSVFENSALPGLGFSNCIDPGMKTMIIRLNNITHSRHPNFADVDDSYFDMVGVDESAWRNGEIPPGFHVNPQFSLDCDGKNILAVSIDPSMVNSEETVKVHDGARCKLQVKNATRNGIRDVRKDYPTWFINYTIFDVFSETEHVEILTQSSYEKEIVEFNKIPGCYLETLENHFDHSGIYRGLEPCYKAIQWLLNDKEGKSRCANNTKKHFVERYALASLAFATNSAGFIDNRDQCSWGFLSCELGSVIRINLSELNLDTISVDIIEILHKFKNLKTVDFSFNHISWIPTEIGLLTTLEDLEFYDNDISSIPTEIGLLKNMRHFYIGKNNIEVLPSEIGRFTNLEFFGAMDNKITSIPSELAMLTNLQHLLLRSNYIVSIPDEIRSMTSLKNIDLTSNHISSIPSELGQLEKLNFLGLSSNNISSVPSEIGLLTNLRTLELAGNDFTSIPHEVAESCASGNGLHCELFGL